MGGETMQKDRINQCKNKVSKFKAICWEFIIPKAITFGYA
jgi:hypothetical protein